MPTQSLLFAYSQMHASQYFILSLETPSHGIAQLYIKKQVVASSNPKERTPFLSVGLFGGVMVLIQVMCPI